VILKSKVYLIVLCQSHILAYYSNISTLAWYAITLTTHVPINGLDVLCFTKSFFMTFRKKHASHRDRETIS